MKAWHVPLRLAAGAFILDQGLSERHAPEDRTEGLYGMATTAMPSLSSLEAKDFVALLSAWELGLGGTLLAPFVPAWVGCLGLVAFSSSLLRLYLKVPGMREPGSLRPSRQGTAVAKDSWLLAIGLALVIDALTDR